MILSELKDFIKERGVVSIVDLIAHFDMDPATLREMLEVWIRKGKVRKVDESTHVCRKCPQCHMQSFELYEWTEEQVKIDE